jgi:hypothetical protein
MIATIVNPARLLLANLFRQVLPLGVAISILGAAAIARATTIATWTFESSVPATSGPLSPEVGAGSATGSHAGATVYSAPAGNGSPHSFSSTLWAPGDDDQFQVSTTGLNDIVLDWDQTSSNTGPRDFQLEYSTDGSTFTPFGNVYSVLANAAPNPLWNATTPSSLYHFEVDLSSVAAIDNAANVYFRLADADSTSANGGTVGTAGTDRVDNFSVLGSPTVPVPEPTSALLAGMAAIGLGLLCVRRRSA